MPEAPILQANGLSKTYQVGKKPVVALRGVSIVLAAGKSMSVVGYSGSGKSTLLGLLGGLDRPSAGEIIFQGRSLNDLPEAELTALRRSSIGFIFQTFNLLPALTALENVLLAARLSGMPGKEASSRARQLLADAGISDRMTHYPSQLSGGEQQRVAVARALAPRPALVLADEPTGDLDSENGKLVADMLLGLCSSQGSCCVIATHNPELAARTDYSIRLKDGSIDDWGGTKCWGG